MEDLEAKIKSLISIRFWDYKKLPEQIVNGINDLSAEYEKNEIISCIKDMVPELKDEIKKLEVYAHNSGAANQEHTAAIMRLKYANQILDCLSK